MAGPWNFSEMGPEGWTFEPGIDCHWIDSWEEMSPWARQRFSAEDNN